MSKAKKVWSDPVGSKLIAEIIKGFFIWAWGILGIPLYAFIKGLTSDISFLTSLKQTWKSIVSFFIGDFQINFLTIILVIIAYIALTAFIKYIIKRRTKNSTTDFNKGNFWGADISWKWENSNGKWKIKYGDYEMSCPKCYHNLTFDDLQGQHHLACRNVTCNFRSGVYHVEPPSNVVIFADTDTLYFHNALVSTVDSELRMRNQKK